MNNKLKVMLSLGFAALLMTGITSCGEEKKNGQAEDASMDTPERPIDNREAIIEISPYNLTDSVSMNGHRYTYTIQRQFQDSVIVVDDEGYKTRDNSILLTIRKDGTPFFEQRFTRSAFHIRVDEQYYRQCVLLGMNFDRTTEYGLRFIASIGKGADGDNYKPYSLTVGLDGSINITEHDLYDDDEVARFEDEQP